MSRFRPSAFVTGALLSSLTVFLVFAASVNNQFVVLDDYGYIVDNRTIDTLSWATVKMSFTSYCEGNWHPLTMLSLALDRYFWGLDPFGYHLVNALIHSCTVFAVCFLFLDILKLIFLKPCRGVLFAIGQAPPKSEHVRMVSFGSIAAALFWGLHPLRVESVVWASERKDVLCLLFVVLSLLMYVKYAIASRPESPAPCRCSKKYLLAVGFAVLAAMSKPTAVSLPFIMMTIDYYPLMNLSGPRSLFRSFREKTPFLLISTVCIVFTLSAQQGAMKYAPGIDLPSRLLVACKALLFYLYVTVIPNNLAAFYIHPGNVFHFALPEYFLYATLILVISITVVMVRRCFPALFALWIFYCVTLAPTLGVVMVGGQWAADRYSYLPSLGMSLLWGGLLAFYADKNYQNGRRTIAGVIILVATIQLSVYTILTLNQITVWRTTETLTTGIIAIYPNEMSSVYLARAVYKNQSGRYEEALKDTEKAMKIALRSETAKSRSEIAFEQAVILKNLKRYKEALIIMEWGIAVSPAPPDDAIGLRDELRRLRQAYP